MKLELRRTTFTPNSTIGELSIDGVMECFTLEDVVRPDGVKIAGETAIPPGTYTIDITMSPRFGQMMPLLVNVQRFVGIRIHPGNIAAETDGCILVGTSKAVDFIGHSKDAYAALFPKLKAAKDRGESITIQVH